MTAANRLEPAGRSVRFRTKREVAYAALRNAIQSGRLAPGERLIISRLANELELSDVPVREALFQLEAEGLVFNRPHVGSIVAEIDAKDVLDVYMVSAIVEGAAAAWAVAHLTDEDLAALDHLLQAMDEAVAAGDLDAFAAHDRAFHRALYRRSPSERLLAIIDELWNTKERARTAFPARARGAESQREHRAIMAAVRARDPVAAERQMRDHLTTAAHTRSAQIEGRPAHHRSDADPD